MHKMYIPVLTIALGVTLNFVGVISYLLSGSQSITALIPAFFGGAFLILGGVAFKTSIRKHVIHGALALALILGAYCTYKVIALLADPYSTGSTALRMFAFETTALSCIAYLAIGVRAFMHARKTRRAESP